MDRTYRISNTLFILLIVGVGIYDLVQALLNATVVAGLFVWLFTPIIYIFLWLIFRMHGVGFVTKKNKSKFQKFIKILQYILPGVEIIPYVNLIPALSCGVLMTLVISRWEDMESVHQGIGKQLPMMKQTMAKMSDKNITKNTPGLNKIRKPEDIANPGRLKTLPEFNGQSPTKVVDGLKANNFGKINNIPGISKGGLGKIETITQKIPGNLKTVYEHRKLIGNVVKVVQPELAPAVTAINKTLDKAEPVIKVAEKKLETIRPEGRRPENNIPEVKRPLRRYDGLNKEEPLKEAA